MHDIWNPWHGCVRKSPGCANCYMFTLDARRGGDGSHIYKTANMRYPLQKNRDGSYKVKSGEQIRVCMTSDFFLEEADQWRSEAWNVMYERPDVVFFLLTKRPERVMECLPAAWGEGWENIFFNVTCENQQMADERMPLLMDLPFKHKGVMCAPFVGEVSLRKWLQTGKVEQVLCDGENYDGARPCHYEWVKRLRDECEEADVSFTFCGTGRRFYKDGRLYKLDDGNLQNRMAVKSGLSYKGRPMEFHLTDRMGFPITEEMMYKKHFRPRCNDCGMKPICNGCSDCGKCDK